MSLDSEMGADVEIVWEETEMSADRETADDGTSLVPGLGMEHDLSCIVSSASHAFA